MLLHKSSISNVFSHLPQLILGIALFLGTTTTVQAEEIRTLKDYLNNCIPEDGEDEDIPEECDRLKEEARQLENEADSSEEEEEKEEDDREEKSGGIGGYTGISLGVYFPDLDEDRPIFEGNDVDISTGFGSSAFVGIQFNRYLGTDLEFNVLAGEIDSDRDEDQNYVMSGVFLNPRFTIPLSNKKNSLALFISPGIGVSQLSGILEDEVSANEINGTENEDGDDDDDFDRTTVIEDDSRFTWQIKGGVSIPVSSKFSIIPQVRYTSQTGDNSVSYFGTEVGMKFDF